jgi:hypothetical protein
MLPNDSFMLLKADMNAHEMHLLKDADVFDRSSRSLRILM